MFWNLDCVFSSTKLSGICDGESSPKIDKKRKSYKDDNMRELHKREAELAYRGEGRDCDQGIG